ncbi:MAG: ribosome silencing factor [Pseudomonadota bacterium]
MTTSNIKSSLSKEDRQKQLLELVLKTLEDMKAEELVTYQLSDHSDIANIAIVCNGRSNRHVRSIASNLALAIKTSRLAKAKVENDPKGEWVLVDVGSIVVHMMQAEVRKYYDLDAFIKEVH